MSQFSLIRTSRFGPFFWTQFLGAFNDNAFKFSLTIWVTYQLSVDWLTPALGGLVIGALFILPYILFSATAGQLADKFNKVTFMCRLKELEFVIMLLAFYGFFNHQIGILLFCLFMMGFQSTMFGPAKYAYLPESLKPGELIGANGLVEMGTFMAILLGNMLGGFLISLPTNGVLMVSFSVVFIALMGRWSASKIPVLASTSPDLKINWNPLTETWKNLSLAYQDRLTFRSMLGISWMWFFGAVFLSEFPVFSKEILSGNSHVATLLLVIFSIGVGIGALMCEFISRFKPILGLVLIGALGMSFFTIDLYFSIKDLPKVPLMGLNDFVGKTENWHVMMDLFFISLSTGLYSVPMYTLIQQKSLTSHRARIIAANNVLNALFMVASALLTGFLLHVGWTIPEAFLAIGITTLIFVFFVFWRNPIYRNSFRKWFG